VSETRSVYTPTDDYDAGELSFYDLLLGRDASHQFTLAHEILHALQDEAYPEYFDTAFQLGQDDLAMALDAAKEGDASYFAGAVLEGLPINGPGMLSDERALLIDPKEFFPNAPVLVGYTRMFPYAFGYRLARNEGKRLLERPPVSTEQVIHLGKRRESFLVMDLGALESMLPNGCRSVTQNTLGEFGILILFHELGAALPAATWTQIAPDYFREAERFGLDSRDLSDSIPETIWEGWDGDRYFVAECGSDLEFIWITAWDSEGDAREFQAGYRVVATELATRNERSDPPRVRLRGRRVIVTTEGLSEISAGLDSRVREKRVSDLASLRVHMLGRAASGGEGTATVPP
jgi:hypothetical protein